MHKNSSKLFGLDKVNNPTNAGAEYVSHFAEMVNINNDSGYKVYMPISDKLIKIGRKGYSGKLHDGLHYDANLEAILLKVEFKSSMVNHFSKARLAQFEFDYSKLGVGRVDLCHLNSSKSCEKTVEMINSFSNKSLIFNPID